MKTLSVVVLTLVALLGAATAPAQLNPQITRPDRPIEPIKQFFPPHGNGAFACMADAGTPLASLSSTLPSLSGRDLSGSVTSNLRMTNDACRSTCASQGFLFAGTQSGSFCFCGNSAGAHGPSSACNAGCTGYRGEVCGGTLANSVSWAHVVATPVPGAPPANGGQCVLDISGPGYHHVEIHRWVVTGPSMPVPTGVAYPMQWTLQGAGGSETYAASAGHSQANIRSWTLSGSASVTYVAHPYSNGGLSWGEPGAKGSGALQEAPQKQYIDGALQTPNRAANPAAWAEYSPGVLTLTPQQVQANPAVIAIQSVTQNPPGYAVLAGSTGTATCTWNVTR